MLLAQLDGDDKTLNSYVRVNIRLQWYKHYIEGFGELNI